MLDRPTSAFDLFIVPLFLFTDLPPNALKYFPPPFSPACLFMSPPLQDAVTYPTPSPGKFPSKKDLSQIPLSPPSIVVLLQICPVPVRRSGASRKPTLMRPFPCLEMPLGSERNGWTRSRAWARRLKPPFLQIEKLIPDAPQRLLLHRSYLFLRILRENCRWSFFVSPLWYPLDEPPPTGRSYPFDTWIPATFPSLVGPPFLSVPQTLL